LIYSIFEGASDYWKGVFEMAVAAGIDEALRK